MAAAAYTKVKSMMTDAKRSAFRKYRDIMYGDRPLGYVIKAELIVTLTSGLPGALGLFLRAKLYPRLFKSCGRGVIFGRNITVRHAHKITLGNHVILDDQCMIDAKGDSNMGITIGDQVFIGRGTLVYCKNGDIHLGDQVNISANCQIFSSNSVTIGAQTVIGAFTYILSGGEYDYRSPVPFAEQSGMETKGALVIGANCWLATHVVVTDAANIGEHCVIGAGAVVIKPIPSNSIAVGIPAQAIQKI